MREGTLTDRLYTVASHHHDVRLGPLLSEVDVEADAKRAELVNTLLDTFIAEIVQPKADFDLLVAGLDGAETQLEQARDLVSDGLEI